MSVAVNVYEGMYILDANRYSRDSAGVSGQIPEMIQSLDGEMLASRLWEERRLAYPINGQRKGTYWLTYFKLDSGQLATLTRQCRLSESILRTLFLKVDERIADALVSHALESGTTQRKAPAAAPAAAGTVATPPVAREAAAEPTAAKPADNADDQPDTQSSADS
jgi:small subunit ribosomal protein S6